DALGDADDLLDRLALAEDHLRYTLTKRAMVIDHRVAEIGEGEIAQALHRLVDIDLACSHLREQLAQLRRIHGPSSSTGRARHIEVTCLARVTKGGSRVTTYRTFYVIRCAPVCATCA